MIWFGSVVDIKAGMHGAQVSLHIFCFTDAYQACCFILSMVGHNKTCWSPHSDLIWPFSRSAPRFFKVVILFWAVTCLVVGQVDSAGDDGGQTFTTHFSLSSHDVCGLHWRYRQTGHCQQVRRTQVKTSRPIINRAWLSIMMLCPDFNSIITSLIRKKNLTWPVSGMLLLKSNEL